MAGGLQTCCLVDGINFIFCGEKNKIKILQVHPFKEDQASQSIFVIIQFSYIVSMCCGGFPHTHTRVVYEVVAGFLFEIPSDPQESGQKV